MQLFERYVAPHELVIFACEFLLIPCALIGAVVLQQPGASMDLVWKVLPMAMLCQLWLYYDDFYDLRLVGSSGELLVRLIHAIGATTVTLGVVYILVPSLALQLPAVLRAMAILSVIVLAWRLLVNRLVTDSPLAENTLIVGTGTAACAVAGEIATRHRLAFRLVGLVDDSPGEAATGAPDLPPIVGALGDIEALVPRLDVHRILVALPARGVQLPAEQLVEAKLAGVLVEDARTAYERLTGKVLLEELTLNSLVFAQRFDVSPRRRHLKRVCDIAFAAVGLVVFAPLMAMTALLVWAGSGWPVLYRQERVGEQGRPFLLYKFRSMRLDAERAGPTWARAGDPRVTAVGRFIRLTRLDELPQLWNVLVGHMSFVGPRPERPCFVTQLADDIPFYHLRHAVKPGITGWAQVRYRYADSLESAIEKLRYDLYYVKHLSLAFDLTIVVDTVKTILLRRGSH